METGTQRTEEPYEAPVLIALGPAEELTQGPNGGPQADLIMPHHNSGA